MARHGFYPSRGLLVVSFPGLDHELCRAISRAYNDWLHDLCSTDPTRLFGAAMVPAPDITAATAEARRTAEEYGFKAIFLTADVYDGRAWDNPFYFPLWEECQRHGLVVGFHTTGTLSLRPGQAGGMFSTWMEIHTFTHAVPCMEAIAAFAAGGVLEEFPDLKVGLSRSNCSWAPWLLWAPRRTLRARGPHRTPAAEDEAIGVFSPSVLRLDRLSPS